MLDERPEVVDRMKGSDLVGLSLSPGLPGPNRATVYLLPVDGSAAAQGLAARSWRDLARISNTGKVQWSADSEKIVL